MSIMGALALGFAIGCVASLWPAYKSGWKDGYYDGRNTVTRFPRQ